MPRTLPMEEHFSKDLLAAIGLAIVVWAAAERALGAHLLRILRTQQMTPSDERAAFIVTSGMEARTLIGLLRSLVLDRFPKHSKEFDKIADGLLSAYTKRRNVLAHNAFAIGKTPDRIKVYEIKTVGQLKGASRELTAKEIHNWAVDFFDLAVKADRFFNARGVPSFPGQSPLGE